MHQVRDITGRGRYLIETANCLISVEVLLHPTGGYVAYTDVSRSVPHCALGDIAQTLLEIAAAINWLNVRGSQEAVMVEEVMGTAV